MDDVGFKNKVNRIKEMASIDVAKPSVDVKKLNLRNNITDIQSIYSDIHNNPTGQGHSKVK